MIFTTYWFVLFAAIVVPIYWCLNRPRWRLVFLGLCCLVFHAHFAGPAGMAPVIVLMAMTYGIGLTRRPGLCLAGIVICGAVLCFYKYVLFFLGDVFVYVNPAAAVALTAKAKAALPLAPPLGISFFAFEFVHYLYEIKKGGEPIRSPLKFLLFSIFFPSLVAGPIKRYTQFIPSLEEGARHVDTVMVMQGCTRIATGLFKKLCIADNMTLYIDFFQPRYDAMDGGTRWTIFLFLGIRILMDFSGYSDIAIGFAQLLGIKLPENFNWPYKATSLQDFWQRWHISLSNWIRDYVYIPLGGSRKGVARRILNGLIAFALCGLWHGPAWHFVIWGLFHGAGLAVCATYGSIPGAGPKIKSFFNAFPQVSWLLTQSYVWIGWLLFFYPVADADHMFRKLITG